MLCCAAFYAGTTSQVHTMYLSKPLNMKNGSLSAIVYTGTSVQSEKLGKNWIIRRQFWISSEGELFESSASEAPIGNIKSGSVENGGSYATFSAAVKEGHLVCNLKDAITEMDVLYYERCGTCHRAYDPEMYTAAHWKKILESMKTLSGISRQEEIQIMRYLSLLAKSED